MSRLHVGWIALAGAAFASIICISLQFLIAPKLVDTINLRFFESEPAADIMSEHEFKYYTRALENLDCDLAGILLNTAFVRYYPRFERARLKQDCVGDFQCSDWNTYSDSIFDEYGFCNILSELKRVEDDIRRQELNSPKFNMRLSFDLPRVKHENPWIDKRNFSISRLIARAETDFVPALLKIGELLRRGDVFVSSTEAEAYVLQRVCFLSFEACNDLEPRLVELQDILAPERFTLIEQRASIKPFAPSFLTDLLIDGKL